MALLVLNGVTVPVAKDSAARSTVYVGQVGERSAAGKLGRAVRATKREWRFKTTPLPVSEVEAWAGLIEGRGHTWTFDAGYTSSRGRVRSSGSGALRSVEGAKYGPNFGLVNADRYALSLGSAWSFIGWRYYSSGGWKHEVLTGTGQRWQNASPAGFSSDFFAVASGDAVFGNTAAAFLDDVAVVPFNVPAAWVPQLYAFHSSRPFSALPRMVAGGTFAPAEVTVRGELAGPAEGVQWKSGGAWVRGEQLEFVLREV